MNQLRYFLFAALAIILCGGCSQKQNNQSATLKLGVMSSMDYLPLAVAQREGYFKELDLNIELVKFYGANDRDAAFQSGNIDGTVIDYTGAVLQKSGGIALTLTSKCDAPFYIVAQSNIQNIKGLKGKSVGISQNTVIDYCLDMALKADSMTQTDVQKVELNKIPVRFEMLMNNKTDAVGLPDPFASMAKNAGKNVLTSNSDLGFGITGIMFRDEALKEKAELIKKMYKAYNKGVEYIKTHSVEDIRGILESDFGFPAELVAGAKLPDYTKAQAPKAGDLKSVSEWLASRKLIADNFDLSTIADDQYLTDDSNK